MLNDAKLIEKHQNLWNSLWAKCAATATKIENIVTSKDNPPAFWAFFQQDAPYLPALRAFGEIGITHNAQIIQSKLKNHGISSMFIGYANDHAAGTYCMLNLETKKVWKTCNVKWIASNIMQYKAQMKRENGRNVTVYGDDDDEDDNYDGIVWNVNDNAALDIDNAANDKNQNNHEDDEEEDDNDNDDDNNDADDRNDNDDNNNDDDMMQTMVMMIHWMLKQ